MTPRRYIPLLLVLFVCVSCNLHAQNRKIDSLRQLIRTEKEDTNKVNHLIFLASDFYTISPDSTILFARQAVAVAKECHFQKGEARSYSFIAIEYAVKGDYPKALDYFLDALSIAEEIGNKQLQASVLGNIGTVYKQQADYPKALDYYLRTLKMDEQLGDKFLQASALGNIGNVYEEQGEYTKALDYDQRSLKIDEETENKSGIASDLGNIGIIYKDLGDKNKALEYYLKALKIAEEIGSKYTIGYNLGNIGGIYDEQGNYNKALDYDLQALEMNEELGNKSGIASDLENIGVLYTKTGKFSQGEEYLKRAIGLDDSIGEQNDLMQNEENLSRLYDSTGNYKSALVWYQKAMVLKDTLFNIDKNKALTRKEMTFEFEKKEAVAEAEKNRERVITLSVSAGLLLVLVFAGFIFRSLRITRKQKQVIEEKSKDILDSITYAKRLQDAILPPLSLIKQHLPESFVLYKPKDIVAGDFYWMEHIPAAEFTSRRAGEDDKNISYRGEGLKGEVVLVAAADCTGHGVPGALVSVVCSNALNRTVKEFKITETGKILDKVRELVVQTFEKSENNVQDGMDISLVAISRQSLVDGAEVQWSGAFNSLLYIQGGEIKEVPADKQPIGKHEGQKPFSSHTLNLKKGDTLYLLTDGYADQFGGPKGKKFKYRQLNDKLKVISDKPMDEQKNILEQTLENWKGDLEQVDDILIIGIRI